MAGLVELVREPIGRSMYDMKYFFQGLVRKGELTAYDVEIDKQVVTRETPQERVVKTVKGATLTSTKSITDSQAIILEDPTTNVKYHLELHSYGGMFYNDGDSQTTYHNCTLERLAGSFTPRSVSRKDGRMIIIQPPMVTARLRVSYSEDWDGSGSCDRMVSAGGTLRIEGEEDALFTKVCEFVREKK